MADTTRYMRVELPTDYEKTERVAVYGMNNTEIEVSSDLLVTADEIPREGEGHTAEEYREVLRAIPNMDGDERKNAFGVNTIVGSYVKDFSASELIEKYRVYINTPKTGEYWKRKGDGEMVVVRYVKDCMVIVYYCDGGFGCEHSLTYFIDYFVRTEHKSRYLADFLNEMKEVSGTK